MTPQAQTFALRAKLNRLLDALSSRQLMGLIALLDSLQPVMASVPAAAPTYDDEEENVQPPPAPGSLKPLTMPFGKFRGTPVDKIDPQYGYWLTQQPFVEEKFPEIHAVVTRLFSKPPEPSGRRAYSHNSSPLTDEEEHGSLAPYDDSDIPF